MTEDVDRANTPASPPDTPSWALLGLIRFLLASIVFAGHLGGFADHSDWVEWIAAFGGKAAVTGFLIISGFAMAHSYRRNPEGFYLRRIIRIYPLYAMAILLCYLMQHALVFPVHSSYWIINASGTGRFVGNAFFLQGLLVRTIGCNLVLWTLAIEAWFYLATPWFATLSNRLLIALIIVSLILFCFLPAPALSPFWGVSAVLYLWPWLLGFMIARKEIPFVALALGLMGLGAVHRFILEPRAGLTYGLVLGAVLGANRVRLPPWLAQITTYLGDLSYPLYLFHLPLIILLYAGFKLSSPAEMAAIILVAVMVIEAGVDRGLKERLWRPVFTAVFHASRAASLRRFSRP